jgi:hypothetical protein
VGQRLVENRHSGMAGKVAIKIACQAIEITPGRNR